MDDDKWFDKNHLREQNAAFLPIIGFVVIVICGVVAVVLHNFQHGGW